MQKIPQQIIPLVLLFAAAIASLLVARHFLVPDSFGQIGHYRASSIDENMAIELVYAGFQVCNECHDDIFDEKAGSMHRGVSCETCHGPAKNHTEEPDEYTPIIPREREHCAHCHGFNPSRPSGFPQIIPELHNPGSSCLACHNPHDPGLPHEQGDCSACHREIASDKAVSHHAALPCTQCHTVEEQHLSNPRLSQASRPDSKQVCGECHDRNAASAQEIPRIDMESHGGRYICWDCHYPHHPEAN